MELDTELWSAFFAETDEHLDVLEQLLARTDWQPGDMAAAFRAMHSLKGLAQAVGLPNMQVLAHHAEDLLGMVRAGQAELDAPLLLAVTDRLRVSREWVERHGADAPADPALTARLDQTVRELSAVAPPPPDPPLSDDTEMLTLYCELLEEQAASLALLLAADSDSRRQGRDHAESLATGAEILGLEQLAADLLALGAAAVELPALSAIAAQLGLLEEMLGAPAGAAPLRAALRELAGRDAAQRLHSVLSAVRDADGSPGLPAMVNATRAALEAAGRPQAAMLMLHVEEALAQIDAEDTASWQNLRPRVIALLQGLPPEGEPDAATVAELQARWSTRNDDPAGDRAARLLLRPELRAVLTPAQLALLERRLAEGAHAYTLLLDLEAEAAAGDVLAWLYAAAEVVTNVTVTHAPDGSPSPRSWFAFLVLSDTAPEHLQAQLIAVDPEQHCVRGLQPVRIEGEPTPDRHDDASPPAPLVAPVIRVRVEVIDRLMDEVSELRVALGALGEAMRSGDLAQELRRLRRGATSPQSDFRLRNLERGHGALLDLQERLEQLHRQVWNRCTELRVVPADSLFARFTRVVRELSQRLGKEVDLELQGSEVRIDKSTADLLADPLLHMLRNALDHGVEAPAQRLADGKPRRASVVLQAVELGEGIRISVADDGAGLDRAAIVARASARGLVTEAAAGRLSDAEVFAFLFRPGFSTAAVVSEISGRGVGLDVVAAAIARLDGRIDIETSPGKGTRFVLSLPAAASLQNVLLVQVPQTLAIAERDVVAAVLLADVTVDRIGPRPVLWYQDAPVPLVSLAALLGLGSEQESGEVTAPDPSAVIVADGQERLALAVDTVPQRRELFLKELHPLLARLPAIAGGAVLGDGRPVLVLDVDGLLSLARAPVAADG